ncbi:MAG: recombinase family protein [Candidatus Eremiobacteraeota bacterium]|nr:recombinase family protein [Candidatus Eremiobacteraeota bacterium]
MPIIREMRAQGHSMAKIADKLNADGFRTQTGALFGPVQVKRILDRSGTNT